MLALSTDEDIVICDPEREYASLAEALGGEVVRIAAGSPHHINAMDMVEGYGEGGNPVADKSEFVLSLFEQLDRRGLGPQAKSVVDRCTSAVYADYLRGRFMLVKKADMFPAECIVRGYLAGSGLKEYNREGTVCGIELPEGLVNSSKLPEPIYTPSTKAEIGDHDENISFDRLVEILGEEDATALRDLALKVYTTAADHAAERGVIIADTKFEFGRLGDTIILADEVLTPDSSRFWPGDTYEEGSDQPSFDKQFVRDWLTAHWDKTGNPPRLPQDIIDATSAKYIQAYETITGKTFDPATF